MPACRAFVLSLFGALTAGKAAHDQAGESPWAGAASGREPVATPHRGRLPVARFVSAARWLLAVIRPRPELSEDFPLEHFVLPNPPKISLRSAAVVYFDASLWGGGAVLYEDQRATAWFEIHWSSHDLRALRLEAGAPRCQTSFEYLTLLLVLMTWGASARTTGLAILGGITLPRYSAQSASEGRAP